MKKLLFLACMLLFTAVIAHNTNYSGSIPHRFTDINGKIIASGYFLFENNNNIHIETEDSKTLILPLSVFGQNDKNYLQTKIRYSNRINGKAFPVKHSNKKIPVFLIIVTALMAIAVISQKIPAKNRKFLIPAFASVAVFAGSAFTNKSLQLAQTNTDPVFLDSTFSAFIPQVSTFHDTTYYYVQSNGLPTTHNLMVGISNHGWQQQVPTPQCYFGTNAWSIPLHPVISSNPIPVDSIHFTRGAIAIAANGIPIFNVHTNTGVDSYIDGQLDNFGGHCGRADDYHYHIAPLHLYNYTPTSLPCAIGLDGYAVYGSTEPNGSPMLPLDANHGHFGSNGVYHYHGTAAAPYMIARMAGVVTEDATHQLIPQPAAHAIRPALTPLNGALITACTPNAANNGFNLTYTLSGQTDSIVYFWNNAGSYTFRFYTAGNGTFTSNTYHSNYNCVNPLEAALLTDKNESNWLAPNPASGRVYVSPALLANHAVLSFFSIQGQLLKKCVAESDAVDVNELPAGIYLCRFEQAGKQYIQKIILQ